MPNPNDVPPARPTDFDIDEIACLLGALAALKPCALVAMPGWPQDYKDAVTKALEMTTASNIEGVDLTYLWVGPFRIVFGLSTSESEGN